jgi:hypothetical protein
MSRTMTMVRIVVVSKGVLLRLSQQDAFFAVKKGLGKSK